MSNERIIELSQHEIKAEAMFHDLLDEGLSIREAMLQTRARYRRSCRAVFYRWLLTGRAK